MSQSLLKCFFLSFLSNKACVPDEICQQGLSDVCNKEGYECDLQCCQNDLCNGVIESGGEGDGEGRKNCLEIGNMRCNVCSSYVAHVT